MVAASTAGHGDDGDERDLAVAQESSSTSAASTTPMRTASRTLSADARISSLWSYQLAMMHAGAAAAARARPVSPAMSRGDLHGVAAGLLVDLEEHRVVAVGRDARSTAARAACYRGDVVEQHHAVGARAEHRLGDLVEVP